MIIRAGTVGFEPTNPATDNHSKDGRAHECSCVPNIRGTQGIINFSDEEASVEGIATVEEEPVVKNIESPEKEKGFSIIWIALSFAFIYMLFKLAWDFGETKKKKIFEDEPLLIRLWKWWVSLFEIKNNTFPK